MMMTFRVLLGTMLLAGGLFAAEPCTLEVHIRNSAAVTGAALFQAKAAASEIFAGAELKLNWLKTPARPGSGFGRPIEIYFEAKTPREERPGSLAFAMPFMADGATIHVYVDRVAGMARRDRLGVLLGHVLAHEIAHVVEGVSRHSEAGVMKARWDKNDLSEMDLKPLRFAEIDVILLQAGRPAPAATLTANR